MSWKAITGKVRIMLKGKEHYEQCAKDLLDYYNQINPIFEERISITKAEYGLTDLQCLGAYVVYVLDNSLHTSIPRHEFFEPGYVSPDIDPNSPCPVCGKDWKREYLGQPVCSNACAKVFYANKS